jgi:hypothetical protein
VKSLERLKTHTANAEKLRKSRRKKQIITINTMAKRSLGMTGPFDLNNEKIDELITKTSAGNYALGYLNKENSFIVKYVGRADSDLNGRLKDHVGEYSKFKFSYATSPKAAFEKECANYHDFGEKNSLDNKIHPDRPTGSNWKCPYCNNY